MRRYKFIDLGVTDYERAFDIQKEYLDKVKDNQADGFLLATEHKPVFTLGRFAKTKNLIRPESEIHAKGIDIVKTNRGGDITFHGPGQVVFYPIFNLSYHYKDVHRYLRELEEVIICSLNTYGIKSRRVNARTGVWTKQGKIASIGIAISRWVTYHGFALNANVDLDYFSMINPCGFKDIKVASMKNILCSDIDAEDLKSELIKNFGTVFKAEVETDSLSNLAQV